MIYRFRYVTLATIIVSLVVLTACVSGIHLNTVSTKGEEISGTYNLILYGGRYSSDLETVAFLDKDGDPYSFEPFAPEDFFTIKKGLSAKEALEKAMNFVSSHSEYRYSQVRKILDTSGNAIGYEVHPLYNPLTYGMDDVFVVSYMLKEEKKISIHVYLDPAIERMLYYGGPGDSRR